MTTAELAEMTTRTEQKTTTVELETTVEPKIKADMKTTTVGLVELET